MELILQKFKLFVIGFFSSIALLSLSLLFGLSANADEYPNKPIEIVIHAKYGGGHAIFWLEPEVSQQKSSGLSYKELAKIHRIVLKYEKILLKAYYELIGPKHK